MLFVYYSKCSTCLKAKKWLDDNGVKYKERHIVEDNPKYDYRTSNCLKIL